MGTLIPHSASGRSFLFLSVAWRLPSRTSREIRTGRLLAYRIYDQFEPDTGSGWYQRRQGASEAEVPEAFALALEVVERVVDPNLMRLQERVDFIAGLKAEQTAEDRAWSGGPVDIPPRPRPVKPGAKDHRLTR
jgi:hypothetical protein